MTTTPGQLAQGIWADGPPAENIRQCIQEGIKAEVAPLFDDLRRFTDRRIAELSAEIHATVQMVDFSEANLSGQLAKIQQQVAVMVAVPAAASRNSGLELEAVVQATEAAANQIMEAAEAIGDWLRDSARDLDSIEIVAAKLNNIFEACTFQDVTGQRVRRAIQHLRQVETMLTEISPRHGAPNEGLEPVPVNPDLVQDDVDRVFALASRQGGPALPADSTVPTELGQEDVDQMFALAARQGGAVTPADGAVPRELGQHDVDRMFG